MTNPGPNLSHSVRAFPPIRQPADLRLTSLFVSIRRTSSQTVPRDNPATPSDLHRSTTKGPGTSAQTASTGSEQTESDGTTARTPECLVGQVRGRRDESYVTVMLLIGA
jgi:hypothetical protein